MKSALLLALAVLAMATLASATNVTLGFENYLGTELFCNYEVLNNNSGFGPDIWQGADVLTACGYNFSSTVLGMSGSATMQDVTDGTGDKATVSKGVGYADNLFDAFSSYACGCGVFTGLQLFTGTNLVPDTKRKKFGWFQIYASGGVIFGDNFGHLTSEIPGRTKMPVSKRMSTGQVGK